MAVPIQTPLTSYTADGTTTVFPYKFYTTEYTDLVVQVAGVRQTSGYTVTGMGNTNGGDVTFATPPAANAEIVIFRETPVGRLTAYQDNGDLLARDVNADFDRIWLVQQEQKASNAANLARPVGGGAWDAQKYQITNVQPGTHPTDVVTYGQMTQLNNSAATSAQNAAGSAANADNSAKAAAASAYEAEQSRVAAWASEQLASNAAAKAGQDASAAATTAINTLINPAVTQAQGFATSAQTSAQSAQTNANAAGASATAAHTSEGNATTAENNAKGYATSALGSAQAAAQSAADAAATAASVNVASINAAIAGKVDKTDYNKDKATFATTTSVSTAVSTALTDYATKTDLQTAVGNIQLPTNVPSTSLGQKNTWLSENVFSGKVSVNKLPSDPTDIVNKAYFDSEVAKYPAADNTAVKDADNRFSAKQTFGAGAAVSGTPVNDNDVVGKKWITDYVTTAVSQAPAASNTVTTDTQQDITANKTVKGLLTISGPNAGITVDSAAPGRFILDRAASVTVPEPVSAKQAATKKYVDDAVAASGGANVVTTDTVQEITAAKTLKEVLTISGTGAGILADSSAKPRFMLSGASLVTVPTPTGDSSAATKLYVDDKVAAAGGGGLEVKEAVYGSEVNINDTALNTGIWIGQEDGFKAESTNSADSKFPAWKTNISSRNQMIFENYVITTSGSGIKRFVQRLTAAVSGESYYRENIGPAFEPWALYSAGGGSVAAPTNMVTTDSAQDISGAKTFTGSVRVPVPSATDSAATKKYVDDAVAATPANMATTDTAQDISGAKTFSGGVTLAGNVSASNQPRIVLTAADYVHVPVPVEDAAAATKKYVDDKVAGVSAGGSGGALSVITVDASTPYELNADPLQTNTFGPMVALAPLGVNKARAVVGRVSGFAHVPPKEIFPWDSGDLLRYEVYLADTYAVSETLTNTTKGVAASRTSKAGAGAGGMSGDWSPLAGAMRSHVAGIGGATDADAVAANTIYAGSALMFSSLPTQTNAFANSDYCALETIDAGGGVKLQNITNYTKGTRYTRIYSLNLWDTWKTV